MKTIAILMAALTLLGASVHSEPVSTITLRPDPFSHRAFAASCCKVCSKGKACGDSCIARDRICHLPPGCACDG